MSPQEFSTLKRYAMKYASDEDDQDELVLQAYEEGLRLGAKRSMPLLVNFMKLRGRENNRSFVGSKSGGKSVRDVWHQQPVSLNTPVGRVGILANFIASYDNDPFGQCVVAGFEDDLSVTERGVVDQIVSGYTDREVAGYLHLSPSEVRRVKIAVRLKARKHLV